MKIISLPENVKLVTGEEEDRCLQQLRAKLYRLNAHINSVSTAVAVKKATATASTVAAVEQQHVKEVETKSNVSSPTAKGSSGGNNNSSNNSGQKHVPSIAGLEEAISRQNSNNSADGGINHTTSSSSIGIDGSTAAHSDKSMAGTGASSAAARAAAAGGGGAEWVEVGIGPLKLLSSRSTTTASSSNTATCGGYNGGNGSQAGAVQGRLVMRREEKQGGIGE